MRHASPRRPTPPEPSPRRPSQPGASPPGASRPRASQRKAETRQRILDAAAVLFRQHGIDGVGVDAVMREAGLTHGGFYLHFASKDALAAEVAGCMLDQAADRWERVSQADDPVEALRKIVDRYLDEKNLGADATCPLTTLGPDVARRPACRAAMADALRGMVDALIRCMPEQTRARGVAGLATMVGAVVLARIANDPAQAQEFLDTARNAVLSQGITPSGNPCKAVAANPSEQGSS